MNSIVEIPLISKAEKLLPQEIQPDDHVFNVYSNQNSNRFLKEIAKKAGIHKNLTNHVGRYTFGSVGLETGRPI